MNIKLCLSFIIKEIFIAVEFEFLKAWGVAAAHRRGFNKAVVAIAHKIARIA